MITLIDMDLGNLDSVRRAFERVGAEVRVTQSVNDIETATALVLPGVGAFGDGMKGLHTHGLIEAVRTYAQQGDRPVFGICLGMQLLVDRSDEHGQFEGLGLVPGRVERLAPRNPESRVPNMGWCDVRFHSAASPFDATRTDDSFYFAHSYAVYCACESDVAATIEYDGGSVVAAIRSDNLFGVQFHPEKSQDAGLAILESFVQQCCRQGSIAST